MFHRPAQKLEYRSDTDFSNISTILLIDKSVKNYKVFVDSVNSSTLAIVYSFSSSKEELLALLKTNFTSISRIGICFASLSNENSQNFLDKKPLFLNNQELPYSENVLFLINVIKKFNVQNVDFLACNTLNYSNWVNYYDILQKNTGVIVGASNDKTGNLKHGGDWVMESTSQDVEFVYFTKSIEYYTYLLDVDYTWSAGYYAADLASMACYNNAIYTPNAFYNTITIASLVDGSFDNYIAGFNYLYGAAISGDYLYVCNSENTSISQISLLNGNITNLSWVTLNSPFGITVVGNDMYVTNVDNGNISKIDILDPTNVILNWATGFSTPQGIVMKDSYAYVANGNGNISQIDISGPTPTNIIYNWATGFSTPQGIVIKDSYIYVANSNNGNISQIQIDISGTPTNIIYNWVTGFTNPFGLLIIGDYMYVSNTGNGNISQIDMLDPSIISYSWLGTGGIPTGIVNTTDNMYIANGGGGGGYISRFNFTTSLFDDIWAIAINSPQSVVVSGDNMYVNNEIRDGYISKINLLENTVSDLFWFSNLEFPRNLGIDDNVLYVTCVINQKWVINKINIPTGGIITYNWVELGDFVDFYDPNKPYPTCIAINKSYMYVSMFNYIIQIDIQSGNIVNNNWSPGVVKSTGIAFNGNYAFVCSFNDLNAEPGYVSLINASTGDLINQYWVTGFAGPTGTVINNNNMYVYNYYEGTISKIFPIPCFKEHTKILTDKGYIKIQDLRKGDLVKTLKDGFKPIVMIGKKNIYHPAKDERTKDQLYVYPKEKVDEVFEDLVLTGCHSVLVDKFDSDVQREKVKELLGNIYVTDKKYRLPACLDKRSSVYEKEGKYTIYHFALENDNYYSNFGVHANGLLVETCSKRYLKELSDMTLIE